jgi:hypothetical protein
MGFPMHVTSIVGARPQFVKLAAISRAFDEASVDHTIIHTGQHYDPSLSVRNPGNPNRKDFGSPGAHPFRPRDGLGAGLRRYQFHVGRGSVLSEVAHPNGSP